MKGGPPMAAPDDGRQLRQRKWLAIGIASLVGFLSYTATMFALIAALDEAAAETVTFALAVGLGSVPFVFIAGAFVSRHPNWRRAVLQAMGSFLVFGVPLGLIVPPVGMAVGLGAGGVVAFRREQHHSLRFRIVAVAVACAFVLLLLAVAVPVGILSGGVAPLLAVGMADSFLERRLSASAAGDGSD